MVAAGTCSPPSVIRGQRKRYPLRSSRVLMIIDTVAMKGRTKLFTPLLALQPFMDRRHIEEVPDRESEVPREEAE